MELPDLQFGDEIEGVALPELKFKSSVFQEGAAPPRPSLGRSFAPTPGEQYHSWAEKFIMEHPNVYGAYGVAKEFSKVGHLKYFYPEEREKLLKLPYEKQTRRLLFDTLEDVGALGVGRILKGLGSIAGGTFEKFTPRLHEFLTKPRHLINKNKYQQFLREIVDADLTVAGKEEPKILQLIRRETEYPILERPVPIKTVEELGAKVIPRAKPDLTRTIETTPRLGKKGIPVEVIQAKHKVAEFRKTKGLPPLKETPIKKLARAQRRKALEKVDAFRISKGLRPFKDIAKDANRVLGEKGAVGRKIGDLSVEQKKALARLMQDAEQAGKTAENFLRESGFSKTAIGVLSKYITQTKPLPKYAQSINLEKQTLSDSGKRLELEMAGPKKYQSWDTTNELSDSILSDPKKWQEAFSKVRGLKDLTQNVDAVRKINVNGIDRLAKMEHEFAIGAMPEEAFQKEFMLMRDDIFKVLSEGNSEIGRALNAHKRIIGTTNQLAKGLSKIEGKMTAPQRKAFANAVKNQENPVAVMQFLDTIESPTLKDYILEYWYNSILSGPPTHAVNTVSNTIWNMYQIAHRVPVAIIDKYYSTLTGKERTRVINEVIPMLAGYKTGLKRGTKQAWDVLRTGKLQNFETKWAQEMGLSVVNAWERSPHPWMRTVAPLISPASRALRAMDVWVNAAAYDAEMMSFATRKGVLKGLKGNKLKSYVDDFVKRPTEEAHLQSMKMAKHSTFMDDPDHLTSWFLDVRRVPAIGTASHFVVPFVNTIGNLTKRGLELTPGIGIAKEAVSRKMGRGLGTPEIIAKQIEGSMLALYVFYKCAKGEVVGAAPQNKAEKERFYAQGKKPWSIKLDDTYISYRRIEPFNTVLASASIAYDNIINAKDDETKTEIFYNMAFDFKNNLIDSSYFQGMQQIFNRHQKMETAIPRTIASFIPYSSFWRSINRAYEKATAGDVKIREDTWLNSFAQVIPTLSGKIPAKLNIWGEEIINPGSILQHWLPYKWSRETQDPVEIELERLNKALRGSPTGLRIYPGQPGKHITIKQQKIKLSDKVYRDYLIDLGHNLRNEYQETMDSSQYHHYTDEKKALYLLRKTKSVQHKIREKVKKKLIK